MTGPSPDDGEDRGAPAPSVAATEQPALPVRGLGVKAACPDYPTTQVLEAQSALLDSDTNEFLLMPQHKRSPEPTIYVVESGPVSAQ